MLRIVRDRSLLEPIEKQQAAEYLQEQNTHDAEMICQICQAPLPFKIDDDNYCFEKVEFLDELGNQYYQNNLARCPNHSAMFQHANGSRRLLKKNFAALVTLFDLLRVASQCKNDAFFAEREWRCPDRRTGPSIDSPIRFRGATGNAPYFESNLFRVGRYRQWR